MNKKMIKLKKETGASGLDVATGALIFMMFTSLIFSLYLQIYKQTSLIKIHENALGYIIQICEDIDMKSYGETEDLAEYKNQVIQTINMPEDKYTLLMYQEKYIDENPNAQDLVKKITINVTYNFDGEDRTITIKKIKVKE
jgi:hypothetical protein